MSSREHCPRCGRFKGNPLCACVPERVRRDMRNDQVQLILQSQQTEALSKSQLVAEVAYMEDAEYATA